MPSPRSFLQDTCVAASSPLLKVSIVSVFDFRLLLSSRLWSRASVGVLATRTSKVSSLFWGEGEEGGEGKVAPVRSGYCAGP